MIEQAGLPEAPVWGLTALFLAAGSTLIAHPRTKPIGIDANMSFLLLAEVGGPGHGWPAAATAGGGMILAALFSWWLMTRLYLARQ